MPDHVDQPRSIAEMIQEDHLRLAVLLDTIEDELAANMAVGPRLAQLRIEYDRHAICEESALAEHQPGQLSDHRRGHDRMRALLGRLSDIHDSGDDIRATLDQVVGLFTADLLPADAIFMAQTYQKRPSAAS